MSFLLTGNRRMPQMLMARRLGFWVLVLAVVATLGNAQAPVTNETVDVQLLAINDFTARSRLGP